ncbi:PcfJ domain-containing protein [Vreelandella aquamarina]
MLANVLDTVTRHFQLMIQGAERQQANSGGGRIAFDFQAAVGYPLTLYLSPWQSPTPFAWESYSDGERIAQGEFLAPAGIRWDMLVASQETSLLAGIPETVRHVIHAAPFLGLELAQVCGQSASAYELAESSPLLLIFLVDTGVQESWSADYFNYLLAQKQTMQCAAVGLPNASAVARLLRRCRLVPMGQRELQEILRTLHLMEDVRLLSHHPHPSVTHLSFMARYERDRWPGLPSLIDEALFDSDSGLISGRSTWLHRMLTDTLQMLPDGNLQALRSVTTSGQLQTLHDRLVGRFNARLRGDRGQRSAEQLQKRHGDYPTPPLAGNESIVPVTSWQGLLDEGQQMSHCVGSYDRLVALGQVAIYHMGSPHHVTVAITRQGQRWVVSQARGPRNAIPSTQAQALILAWLEHQ